MPKSFIFQHDMFISNVCFRFAILRFTDRSKMKVQYAPCIAVVDEDGCFSLKEATVTNSLKKAIQYLKDMAVLHFCNSNIALLFEELNRL